MRKRYIAIALGTVMALAASVRLAALEGWENERFPQGYAEIEYPDMETAEAYDGARFDDMNYLRHFER